MSSGPQALFLVLEALEQHPPHRGLIGPKTFREEAIAPAAPGPRADLEGESQSIEDLLRIPSRFSLHGIDESPRRRRVLHYTLDELNGLSAEKRFQVELSCDADDLTTVMDLAELGVIWELWRQDRDPQSRSIVGRC